MAFGRSMEYTLYHATWCPFCRGFAPEFRRGLPEGEEYLLDDMEDPLWVELKIDVVPTVIGYENGKEVSRIEARPHIGIDSDEFKDWIGDR